MKIGDMRTVRYSFFGVTFLALAFAFYPMSGPIGCGGTDGDEEADDADDTADDDTGDDDSADDDVADDADDTDDTADDFTVTSPDFDDGDDLPPSTACTDLGGENVPPVLNWTGAPEGTLSFAITMIDADAGGSVAEGFIHGVFFNIPATVDSSEDPEMEDADTVLNDAGTLGYFGPCPPDGPAHTYVTTIWALGVTGLATDGDAASTIELIEADDLASDSISGEFAAP